MGIFDRINPRFRRDQPQLLAPHFADVQRWLDIYNGGGDWRYARKGGINGGSRRVASLGAAKALCSELARLCFTEGTQVCSPDPETQQFITATLANNRFAQRFPDFLEKVFALGGGAVKVYWDGEVKLDLVTADRFVPTAWDNRRFTGAAFASNMELNGNSLILAESQSAENGSLVIRNELFSDSGRPEKLSQHLPRLSEKSVINGLGHPLFVYFSAGSAGNTACSLLGGSVFRGAVDTLRSIDLVFDSLSREFVLGRKRIIVPYYAIRGEYDENGDIRRYFDVNDEVFQAMSVSDAEELKITDNTAQLRVSEHTEALAALLDLLCMQAGLSEGALSYKDGALRTATEVVSRNSRTYRTQAHYRGMISAALSQVTELMCILGKMSGQLSDGASGQATVMFADGVAEDDATRTERAVKLYQAGLITKERALSQIYGITPEEAAAMDTTTERK